MQPPYNSNFVNHPLYLPLSSLIAELQENGFIIGVDNWQTLFQLLNRVDFDAATIHPDKLKGLLCPLFATNASQQTVFYYLFDKHLAETYKAPPYDEHLRIQQVREIQNDRQEMKMITNAFLLAFAVIVASVVIVWLIFELRPLEKRIDFKPTPPPQYLVPQPAEEETPNGQNDPAIDLRENPDNEPASLFPTQPLFDPDLHYFQMKDFWKYRLNLFLVKAGVWVIIAGTGLWAVFLFYRRKRNNLLRRHHDSRDALAYWPVKSNEPLHVQLPAQFYQAANNMRKRILFTSPLLDMPASIKATIYNGGRFVPQFRQRSRPAEYLVLLPEDHANNLFVAYQDYLFGLFGKTDIILHRYYYKNNPESFRSTPTEKPLGISGLLYHHANARLILLTDAQAITAHPALLAEQFSQWADKAVLLIQPDYVRGWATHFTAAGFFVAEAGIASLMRLVDFWENETAADTTENINYGYQFNPLTTDVKQELLNWFAQTAPATDPVKMLQWFTACLLVPELHWDILLSTGKILSEGEHRLVSLFNLESICRLPWLKSGTVPHQIREQLCYDDNILSVAQKELLLNMLIELLGNNLPDDPNTFIYDQRQLHIAFLEAQLSESVRSKNERLRKLKQKARSSGNVHQSVNLLLNRETFTPLARLLPGGLQQQLYENKQPWQGWKPVWGTIGVGILALVIFFLLNTNPTIGNLEAYNSQVYFIDSPEKQADFQNHKAAFYYNPYFGNNNYKSEKGSQENRQASTLLDSALQIAPMHAATVMNNLVRDYNYALHDLNSGKIKGPKTPRIRPLDSRIQFTEKLIFADTLTGKPNTDSLRTHFLQLKTQYYFLRWATALADGKPKDGEKFRSRVDTVLLLAGQRGWFRGE